MIHSEDDVRAHVRAVSRGCARWVEPAIGSTFGLPDCWVPKDSYCVHIELKCGQLKDGVLKYTVRPEQQKQLKLLKLDRVPCGLLIGVEGTVILIAAKVTPASLSGRLKLEHGAKDWLSAAPLDVVDWRRTIKLFMERS